MLRIARVRLPKGCAQHTDEEPDVKGYQPVYARFDSVAAFGPFREGEIAAAAVTAGHGPRAPSFRGGPKGPS